MNETKRILQSRAKEVLQTYPLGRFADLEARGVSFGYLILPCTKRLEGNYRRFLEFMNNRGQEPWAPFVGKGHWNPFQAIANKRRDRYDVMSDPERFFYEHLGTDTLDLLVAFSDWDEESLALLPEYWPEEFEDQEGLKKRFVGDPPKVAECFQDSLYFLFYSALGSLRRTMGAEALFATLLERIPHFPEEVGASRLEILQATPEILDDLYRVGLLYTRNLEGT